jgi:uncharacterized protein with HEPN domain
VSRRPIERLDDIEAASDAISAHLARGGLDDGLVFDAVRVRLIETGEAVRGLDDDVRALEPEIPWADIVAMRNHLAHRYFDTAEAIIRATIENDLPPLLDAVERMRSQLD